MLHCVTHGMRAIAINNYLGNKTAVGKQKHRLSAFGTANTTEVWRASGISAHVTVAVTSHTLLPLSPRFKDC